MDILNWIQDWYLSECNGDWEHTYGILIETVDNPGWFITINIEETSIEKAKINSVSIENSETDWYFYKIEDFKYKASGDPSKLKFLLEKFKDIAENNNSSSNV